MKLSGKNLVKINNMNVDMEIIMNNTYGVLTNRVSVEEILEQYVDGKLDTLSDAMFYGNPHEMTVEDIDEVINFFENTEEYEKCSELLCVKDDKLAELITKKLMRNVLR